VHTFHRRTGHHRDGQGRDTSFSTLPTDHRQGPFRAALALLGRRVLGPAIRPPIGSGWREGHCEVTPSPSYPHWARVTPPIARKPTETGLGRAQVPTTLLDTRPRHSFAELSSQALQRIRLGG
jgi:hypothetical protein